ncbi:hypothetical protein [Leptospira noguchii]|uniref:hypothetical protein n=1 Tax=Leptospira noguchii TaxID=28182 RepID=UPI001FB63937|nr:hypothetical protein [Leptospira noguchii]UOG48279.1 hypothetical protein MAL00_14870 [Leptospira noguchii]
MNELKHNAFLNSASRFWKLNASLPELSKTLSIDRVNSAKRFLRKRFRSLEVTQRYLYFIKIESNSGISQ